MGSVKDTNSTNYNITVHHFIQPKGSLKEQFRFNPEYYKKQLLHPKKISKPIRITEKS